MITFEDFMEKKDNDPCWKNYKQQGMKKKGKKEVPNCIPESFEAFCEDKEKEKPFKGYDAKKNHREGGLSRAEAKKQGIHAGIDTKREIEKKGGVANLSDKTAARRKSFCARRKGMKEKNTSSEKARDPDSKINASLRVWKC